MDRVLAGKVALVTGGGTGIGRGIAYKLASAGAAVAVVGLEPDRLIEVSRSLSAQGVRTLAQVVDVRQEAQVNAAVAECARELGRVDVLVNNAGLFPNHPSLEMTEAQWDAVVDTNLKGAFLCSRAVARQIREQGSGGRIVNISSTASKIARPGVAHYGSSKAALTQMTAVLAVEWAPLGITVNCVAPGIIETEQVRQQMSTEAGRIEYESRIPRIPLGRFGKVEDVAEAVFWFCSPASAYCTGSLLFVDGGYSLGVASYAK